MPNFWTIDNDPPPSPGVGNALNGLQIQQLTSGTPPVVTGYQLMNGSNQLSSTSDTTMPISFDNVSFAHRTWNLTDIDVTAGANGSGDWSIIGVAPEGEDDGDNGEFTAQVGTVPEGEEGDAASSAYA